MDEKGISCQEEKAKGEGFRSGVGGGEQGGVMSELARGESSDSEN